MVTSAVEAFERLLAVTARTSRLTTSDGLDGAHVAARSDRTRTRRCPTWRPLRSRTRHRRNRTCCRSAERARASAASGSHGGISGRTGWWPRTLRSCQADSYLEFYARGREKSRQGVDELTDPHAPFPSQGRCAWTRRYGAAGLPVARAVHRVRGALPVTAITGATAESSVDSWARRKAGPAEAGPDARRPGARQCRDARRCSRRRSRPKSPRKSRHTEWM